MRKFFFLITALLLLAGPALGYDVLLVQSSSNSAYTDIVRGFRSACGRDSRLVVLSDFGSVDVVRIVREDKPRVIVAVGDEALASVKTVRQTPVVAVMTLGLRNSAARPNVTGIDVFVDPASFIDVLETFKAKRVGIIYNPGKSGSYVKRAAAAARRAGIDVVLREVQKPQDTVFALKEMDNGVDALWMVPDPIAVVRETLTGYFEFSLQRKVPVISFTAAHLRLGAAAAVDIDRRGLGRQAGQMANKILNGATPSSLPVEQPEAHSVRINPVVLQNLEMPVPPRYSSVASPNN